METNTKNFLARWADIRGSEFAAVGWSFLYFFCLLCGYYVVRPVRDEMGIQAGLENLPWLFTATFVAMLAAIPIFGWVSSRFPRRKLLPYVYLFFVANLLIFFGLFTQKIALVATTKAFFVWVSVYNLFVISVFWSFMADLWNTEQARRLYGFIAAGGSVGAVAGPALTTVLAVPLGPVNLLVVSAGFLLAAMFCILRLVKWASTHAPDRQARKEAAVGGGIFDGVSLVVRSPYLLGICGYVILYSTLSTFLYFEQQHIIKDAITSSAQRTSLFAGMDLAVNSLTLLLQLTFFSRFLRWFGLTGALLAIPVFTLFGFLALGLAPTLMVLVVFGVLRRAGEFAIGKPARETLFNIVSRDEKYKAKNFMDTAVYRGGDAASGWAFHGLQTSLGLGLSAISYIAVPLAAAWAAVGWWLARQHARISAREEEPAPTGATPIAGGQSG